ncbi:LOW QUALITY PROTEIN: acetyltransferase, GNAT family [Geomicrobium sp. JCM 19038]|nr:LOW QUALITY PROTEIN: acetyltransferase, GNAT family [Geomicrobium sp. JCM 19038]
MRIVSANQLPSGKVEEFFIEQWGSKEMVLSTGIFDCTTLDGFAVVNASNQILAYCTYVLDKKECELISIDSLEEGKGIGSSLLRRVEQVAKESRCKKIKLITTNDNLHALGFYQKRGYYLTEVYPGAVRIARERKPEIPLIRENGIPVHDEILLTKRLDESFE